jgi:RimJ/RimL family protein N-acetyltransferase
VTHKDDMPEQSRTPNLPIMRPIRPSDARCLQAFHRRLSEETVRRRYFAPHPILSDREARYFTELDPSIQAAMIASVDRQIVAVGRYHRVPGGETAEVAFVVDDRYQRRGLCSRLLSMLVPIAWSHGIRYFFADIQSDNLGMLRVLQRSTAVVTVRRATPADGVTHLEMELVPPGMTKAAPFPVPSPRIMAAEELATRSMWRDCGP